MTDANAFRTFITICSLFRSELLNANIKLTLSKAVIRSVMTYACPTWELATDYGMNAQGVGVRVPVTVPRNSMLL
jgi:hypothetical protein